MIQQKTQLNICQNAASQLRFLSVIYESDKYILRFFYYKPNAPAVSSVADITIPETNNVMMQ